MNTLEVHTYAGRPGWRSTRVVLAANAVALLLVVLAAGENNLWIATFSFTASLVGFVALIPKLNAARLYSSIFFLLFMASVPTSVFIFNVVLTVPFSNWRAAEMPQLDVLGGLMLLLATQNVLVAQAAHDCSGILRRRPSVAAPHHQGYAKVVQLVILVIAVLVGLGLAASTLSSNRSDWNRTAELGDRFFLQAGICVLLACQAVAAFHTTLISKLTSGVAFGVMAVLAVFGSRYGLISSFIILAIQYLATHRIKMRHLVVGFGALVLLYHALLVLAYVRQTEATPARAVAMIAGAEIPLMELYAYSGAHEQIMLYSLLRFMKESPDLLWGATYLDSVIRIMPNAIHSTIATERPQDVIATVAPTWFQDNNFNIGAYGPTEGYINFGLMGALLVPWLYLLMFRKFDKAAARSRTGLYRSAVAGSFAYLAAFYGSTNLFKSLAFTMLMLFLYSILDKILTGSKPKQVRVSPQEHRHVRLT
jgi:hypothetical protein